MAKGRQKKRRVKLSLATAVGLSFGAFVALAIGLVLALSITANFRNTFSLLNDKTILSTQALEQQVRTHFESVENAVVGLKAYFDEDDFGFDNPARTLEDLSIALKANRDITALRVTDPEGQRLGIFRSKTGKLWKIESDRPAPGMTAQDFSKLKPGSGPVWGALILNESGLFANVSLPLVRDGQVIGVLTAASSIDNLAQIIAAQDEGADDTVFMIAGDGQVIMHSDAHRLQTGGSITNRIPGPRTGAGDPVLAALGTGERMEEFEKAADLGIDVSFVEANDDEYLLMYKELAGFSDKPMIIGQYFLGATVSREVRRLAGSMFVGFGALVISVLIAFGMGKRVARPLRCLAVQSERVGSLSLNDVEPLPRSRIAEIDQVAQAFNAMVEGLKAMNTYVPRSLFIKLMRLGGGDAAEAREAELTVLFTDIVNFTARSEHLSAAETARVLNDHFAILVEAVESEGGTVDKFLGDGMLAFWGAPDARHDHAEAAVRTARRIAAACMTRTVRRPAAASPGWPCASASIPAWRSSAMSARSTGGTTLLSGIR